MLLGERGGIGGLFGCETGLLAFGREVKVGLCRSLCRNERETESEWEEKKGGKRTKTHFEEINRVRVRPQAK